LKIQGQLSTTDNGQRTTDDGLLTIMPSELFLKIASLPVVLTAAFVWVVFTAFFFKFNPAHAIEASFKKDLNHDLYFNPETRPYSPRKLYAMLDKYTDADYRAHYKALHIDFVYPLIYATATALLIVYLQGRISGTPDRIAREYLVLLPLMAALADYLEDISLYKILRRYQAQRAKQTALVYFSVMMTIIKFLLLGLSILIIVAGLLKLAFE
jgi:hypothetical protein